MKKIGFILLCLLTSLTAFSVRLDKYGQKMVKEFTVRDRNDMQIRFVYDYDNNNSMIKLSLYDKDNNLCEEIYKEDNEIKYKSKSDLRYNIFTDQNDNIYHVEVIGLDIDNNLYCKYEYFFDYVFENDRYRADKSTTIEYVYSQKEKQFIVSPNKIYRQIINENGFYKHASDWRIEADLKHLNDTNISFCRFINPAVIGDYYVHDLMLTDWINIKSIYFPYDKEYDFHNYQFKYDDEGNLIQIKEIENKILQKEIDIKYVD